ncbi:DUF3732 domain-containing protein [Methanococcoides sp. AM1]|uniref:DUF3732 domain-containing protein n=1 Tax=Methanococcoides sp. AM1 TaxID=1201011 RepID=UPI0010827C20|nr:DUF3732 domain-containing protein [Methanococcoides sp. AM1]
MKSCLLYIGVIDKLDKVHFVEFGPGVNVITGKSSTGKSAMIEIFDYCFGSSEFTIPAGIITDSAQLYFIVLSVKETNIILARTPQKKAVFLKTESSLPNIEDLSIDYFDDNYFINFKDFKLELGRYFGLEIVDTDEDLEDRKYTKMKKARPSIRNMTPFMLQHQNLIANKHAIFYRFDEKEKREHTIDQFKIFAGFVNQEYFLINQKLADEERNLKQLERKQKSIEEQFAKNCEELENLLKEFIAITGNECLKEKPKTILSNPANYLDKINSKKIESNYESNEALIQLQNLKERKNNLFAQQRTLQIKLNDINSSVEYANNYKEYLNDVPEKDDEIIYLSQCPFCKTSNESILTEANLLSESIKWLNDELSKSTYLLDSFESDKKRFEQEIKQTKREITGVYSEITKLENITKNLRANRDLDEQGLKVKLKIENFLEKQIAANGLNLETEMKNSKDHIKSLKSTLREKYNVEHKLKDAETYINNTMNQIGNNFDFEESYKPVNLKFSLDRFELWNEKGQYERIYLRSMGSGANWLYSHLTLFMSLHKYFCSLGSQSLLPPILFLDQPSQVYFPTSIVDDGNNFDASKLKEKEGKKEKTDDDLAAVNNLFDQIVKFANNTLKETGIKPQIIITDHADNLKLDNAEFDSLVKNRRWRDRGFIVPSDKISEVNILGE